MGLLKYRGGGDWYANLETSLPNLISFCNTELGTQFHPEQRIVSPESQELYNVPFVHMTGHGNVVFSNQEAQNLRDYLLAGGFLHIDDNYGMDPYIRLAMKQVFPALDWVALPPTHPIFQEPYAFPDGVPKVHKHEGKAPQVLALIKNGRIICLYTYEVDLGDGWEDIAVHGDSQEIHELALKMGANIIYYVFSGRLESQQF